MPRNNAGTFLINVILLALANKYSRLFSLVHFSQLILNLSIFRALVFYLLYLERAL
jgi:hypothetical protein